MASATATNETPPAAEAIPKPETSGKTRGGPAPRKRPDRAVYVPRGRRSGGGRPGSHAGSQRGDERHQKSADVMSSTAPKFANAIEELKDSLGENVKVIESAVVVPENDDGCYLDRPAPSAECILEVHDFAPHLKTMDIKADLNTFRNKYELRWVDDTHAIAIFHTRVAATAALAHDGFKSIKLRSLDAATDISKEKAGLCMSKAGPGEIKGPRPETSTLIARRMLGGALGVSMSLPTDVEERERDKLKNAKKAKDEVN